MTIKCYRKPKRSKPRKFSCNDVKRIVRYAKNAGCSDIDLFVAFSSGADLGDEFCGASKAIANILSITKLISEVGGVVAIQAVINAIIVFLQGSEAAPTPIQIKLGTAAVIAILVAINKTLSAIQAVIDNFGALSKVRSLLDSSCKVV